MVGHASVGSKLGSNYPWSPLLFSRRSTYWKWERLESYSVACQVTPEPSFDHRSGANRERWVIVAPQVCAACSFNRFFFNFPQTPQLPHRSQPWHLAPGRQRKAQVCWAGRQGVAFFEIRKPPKTLPISAHHLLHIGRGGWLTRFFRALTNWPNKYVVNQGQE